MAGTTGGVQTFVPYPDFAASARVLDPKRLGKQRVEALQIIRALTREQYGWRHHPAVLMWRGHEEALGRFGLTIVEAWTDLGFADTCAATMRKDLAQAEVGAIRTEVELAASGDLPPWIGDEAVHLSHQSALVRKDPAYYRAVFPDVRDDLEYVWPVRAERSEKRPPRS